MEDDKNNESNRRVGDHNENTSHSSKDIEKQKTNCQIYSTPKYDKEDIDRKNTNNNKGNITENITSRNESTIHIMEQEVQTQKGNHEPNTNNSMMRIMVDMWNYNTSDQSNNAFEGNVSMITNNDKGDKGIVASGKIIDEQIVKDTTNNKIKQNILHKRPNVLDNNKSDQSNNASEGNVSMITNNDR